MEKRQQKPQQQQINPQVKQAYMKLKKDYSQLFKIFLDLEEEKKEHNLVLETVKDLEPERNCWRKVGGVLVKRTIQEVIPSLKQNIVQLDVALQKYSTDLKKKEKELVQFEIKYGLRQQGKGKSTLPSIQEEKVTNKGVLA